ncbi:MAG: hypothetical protein ACOYNC_01015 [Bacteroidales bacterium]
MSTIEELLNQTGEKPIGSLSLFSEAELNMLAGYSIRHLDDLLKATDGLNNLNLILTVPDRCAEITKRLWQLVDPDGNRKQQIIDYYSEDRHQHYATGAKTENDRNAGNQPES